MLAIADDLAYLIMVVAGDLIITLLAFVVLFAVVLAVRDGLGRAST